jgi:hypothetical protein
MDRRLFVKLSAFSAAAISMSLIESCQTRSGQKSLASPDLLAHILEKDALMEIGKTYLSQVPSEQEVDKLISLLLLDSNVSESSDADIINSFLINKISHDFETDKTVIIKGWILSITEARQSALFFLLQK